jgi:hypothetical protein
LRRAQADIDRTHEQYTHYYRNELPQRYHDTIDVSRFGPGERLVYEPYTKETYDATHDWVEQRGLFDADKIGRRGFEKAVATRS